MPKTLDRIIFIGERGQENFLNKVKNKTSLSIKELAGLIKKSDRTMRDWFRGKYKMPYTDAVKLSRISGVSIPSSSYKEDWEERLRIIGKKGGISHFKKYGRVKVDEKKRKEKWREWWESEGRFKDHPLIGKTLPFKRPVLSKELAEFVGIVLGDGSITRRQVTIYLHREDDREYGKFVSSLAQKLFDVPVGIYHHKSSNSTNYIISRTDLVCYLTENLGLKIGNKIKQQVDIPNWIKSNKSFSRACVRGLIDTDGCFFKHRYKVGGKLYSYNKILFTSKSKPLLQSVSQILKENDIKSRFTKRYDLWLDSKVSVGKYIDIIGTHNPKHLNRHSK